jgi:hypothetical protein
MPIGNYQRFPFAVPPFGTRRDPQTGYLIPTETGAWYLPDGTYQRGTPERSPDAGAVWRPYYQVAKRILEVYAEGLLGMDAIAYQMQIEGQPFRDRSGMPVPMESDDVRRVVANWPEYGGVVTQDRARERHPHDYPLEDIILKPERAVFDLELLYQVGRVRLARTSRHQTPDDKINVETYPYPLNGITYCAHCEQRAHEQQDPKLRSRLGGKGKTEQGRYRHRPGVRCGCTNRSVRRDLYEQDFARLLSLLTIDLGQVDVMAELGVHALRQQAEASGADFEREKGEAIARCRRRIDAARHLYEDGDLTREEYVRRKEQNEREIAHWQSRTSETEQIALELTLCVQAVQKINALWEWGTDEDKQGMARTLFSSIVYDLDTQRIVDFRLKPWADRFVTLRAALYDESEANKNPLNDVQGVGTHVTLTGFVVPALHSVVLVAVVSSPLSSSYSLPRNVMNLSAQGFNRKSTIRCASRSYTI